MSKEKVGIKLKPKIRDRLNKDKGILTQNEYISLCLDAKKIVERLGNDMDDFRTAVKVNGEFGEGMINLRKIIKYVEGII